MRRVLFVALAMVLVSAPLFAAATATGRVAELQAGLESALEQQMSAEQATRALDLVTSFAGQYMRGLEIGHPEILSMPLEDLIEVKLVKLLDTPMHTVILDVRGSASVQSTVPPWQLMDHTTREMVRELARESVKQELASDNHAGAAVTGVRGR